MAPPVFKTGLAGIAFAGGFDSLPPPVEFPGDLLVFGECQLEMKLGGFTNVGEDLVQRFARRDAPRKVGTYAEKFSGPLSITTA